MQHEYTLVEDDSVELLFRDAGTEDEKKTFTNYRQSLLPRTKPTFACFFGFINNNIKDLQELRLTSENPEMMSQIFPSNLSFSL